MSSDLIKLIKSVIFTNITLGVFYFSLYMLLTTEFLFEIFGYDSGFMNSNLLAFLSILSITIVLVLVILKCIKLHYEHFYFYPFDYLISFCTIWIEFMIFPKPSIFIIPYLIFCLIAAGINYLIKNILFKKK